jgi:predicted lysophospholipase L1 biosynthesis ABC-type transport system permease subunit
MLGLAAYSTIQRAREIGIRKVLGASVTTIIGLLSKEFLRLVFIALVIASPIAWFAMHSWLRDFAYRTAIALVGLPARSRYGSRHHLPDSRVLFLQGSGGRSGG